MAKPQSPEARELALIDKVELRIALADDDAKLQSTLNTYLAPLLLKLTSEHTSARNKVIGICQHINTRIAPQNIKLPIVALIKQFKDHPESQLVRHFDLLYIQRGFPRLSESERAKLFPVFVSGISSISSVAISQAAVVFHLLIQSLVVFPFPPRESPEDEGLRSTLGISTDDARYLAHWMGKLMSFKSTSTSPGSSGLSKEEQDFLTLQGKDGVWSASTLMQAKYSCLRFLGSHAFKNTERLMPVLLASADANARVSDLAENILKLTLPEVDTNDTELVGKLFGLYLQGSSYTSTRSFSISVTLRIKILALLTKTSTSAAFTNEIRLIISKDLVENTGSEGREVTKLRALIVQLLGTAAQNANTSDFKAISHDVLDSMRTFLDQQYDATASSDLTDLRCRSFEVVGVLISSDEELVADPELTVLRWLYRSLAEERNKQVVFSIDEAISRTIRPLQKDCRSEILQSLRDYLKDCIGEEMTAPPDSLNGRNKVHTVARLANRCLPFSDVTARAIDVAILSSAHSRTHEINEEASKGLDPHWTNLVQPHESDIIPPNFNDIAKTLLSNQTSVLRNPETSITAIQFCRRCLFWSCLEDGQRKLDFPVDWANQMDIALNEDYEVRSKVCQYLHKQRDTGVWDSVVLLYERTLHYINQASQDRATAASVVVELTTLSPHDLVARIAPTFDELRAGLSTNDLQTRVLIAQSYGVLASHEVVTSRSLEDPLSSLVQRADKAPETVGAESNRSHGSIFALANFSSIRKMKDPGDKAAQDIASKLTALVLNKLITSPDTVTQDAAFRSISRLCMFGSVQLHDINQLNPISTVSEKIVEAAKDGKEAAILALGHLSMILDENENEQIVDTLIDHVRNLHEIRQPDTHFSVGESLANIGAAWRSKAMLKYKNVDWPLPPSPTRTKTLKKIIQKILQDSKTTKPALKKASVIWLLCLLQFCGDQSATQEHLPQFQTAFKRCLSDRDELVQESASRGLGLVYERGSRELKDDLVRDLINSFSSNKAGMSGTVTEDTQLFESGALPTGEGSVTTYKDIMSLASEVGDPSLVYRFMSLASNNAIWSNRAAFGRFGLSSVLSDASVGGYLSNNPKMYSALYRYRFDPNSNVRRSMNDIWNALVRDPTATVEDHFEMIVSDLLDHMTGREWRVRQASCAAVADIVQGRRLTKIQPYLNRTWSQCFKVLDDIKETVRAAAADLARVLTNILLRNLESNEGKGDAIGELLKSVIPFILSTSGLESSAKDVQMLSLKTLLDIIKKAKPVNLRPFIPDLINELLSLLTSFEPEAVNYVALNAQKYNLSQMDIDDARLKSIRSSPIMEAIERALDVLDEETMTAAAPKLQESMRSAVGVPSKVGLSRVLVSLSTRKNMIFRPFADDFLRLLEKRVVDRNETVSSSYAASMGYLARLGSDSQVLKTIQYAKELYLGDADDDRPRYVSGEILQAIAKHATDRFNALAADTIPFIFLGRFDDTTVVRGIFRETYDDVVSGSRAVSLYLSEIVSLSESQLASPKWTLKHAAAKAVAEAAEAIPSSRGGITTHQAEVLWRPLKTALAEKSWQGKGRVLEGFVAYVEKSHNFWQGRAEVRMEVKKIALREARRRNKDYQVSALVCLGKVAAAMHDEDMLQDVVGITMEVMDDAARGMDLDESDVSQTRLVAGAVEATFASLQLAVHSGGGDVQDLPGRCWSGLDCAQTALNLPMTTSTTAAQHSTLLDSIFAALKRLCHSIRFDLHPTTGDLPLQLATAARPGDPEPLAGRIVDLISSNKVPNMQERPRMRRAEALVALTEAFPFSSPGLVRFRAVLASRLGSLVGEEKSVPIRNLLVDAQQRVS